MLPTAGRAAIRAVVASAGVGLIAGVLLLAGARWWLPHAIHGPVAEGAWTARSRALFTPAGFFRPEFDTQTGRHYSWTTESAQLEFRRLNRSVAYLVTLEVRDLRPPNVPRPTVRVSVDGRLVLVADMANAGNRIVFEIPRRDGAGATVTLDVSPAYLPGPPDPRALGVIVDDVSVAPVNGAFQPIGSVLMRAALAVMLCALALWLLGLRGALFGAVSAGVALAFVWLLLKDAAFAGTYVDRLVVISFAAAVGAALVGAIRLRWPLIGGVPDWSVAAGLVLAGSVVKLGLFWHPLAIVGDGLFQAHRAQLVHAGSYFFTSVTPRPFYEFPYAVALYVAAQPFWNLFPTELDQVRLLRALSLAADALVGVALYAAARRRLPDRRAVLFLAALWPFARAPVEALSNANLTNLFGQGLFGVALAALAWMAAGTSISWPALLLILSLLSIAFLSHFGTVTVGLLVLGVVALAVMSVGRGHVRRVGVWICALTIAAAAVSWVAYYSHPRFKAVYATTFASVAAREQDNSSKIDAAPSVKLQRWWSGVGDDYGLPGVVVLATALAGVLLTLRRWPPDGVTLVFTSWLLAWLALSVLGIFTAITVRANLATAPAFVFFCGVTLAAFAARSRAGTVAALALFAILAWDGWQIAVRCLDLPGAK